MSKTNTLLNYFTRTPVTKNQSKKEDEASESTNGESQEPQTPKSSKKSTSNTVTPKRKALNRTPSQKTPETNGTGVRTPKRPRTSSEKLSPIVSSRSKKENVNNQKRETPAEDNDEVESPPHKKRRRIVMELESEGEDSADEYIPNKKDFESSDESEDASECEEEDEASDVSEESCSPSPNAARRRRGGPPKTARNNVSLSEKKTPLTVPPKVTNTNSENWPHLKLPFLQPDKIKDAERRPLSDPNYDPKTLYVPDDFKKTLTPAVRQWWEMKSKNFDIVLFFKVGKFYELYHMDAVVAANELNLTFMRGEFAHVGFPEVAYGRFSSTLVEKGYKVARVEQTETPEMMNERCQKTKQCTKFDKVVKREICQITSRGTRVFGILDGETKEAENNFLLAIAEKEVDSASSIYGVCFVDTSIGTFHVGQFRDDRHASRLRTLIAHYPPVQVLYEKNQVSACTQQVFQTALVTAIKDKLVPDKEFWTASTTLIKLAENYYENRTYPDKLAEYVGPGAVVNMTVDDDKELGIRSLGAVVWYLQRCLIDYQLLTMRQFSIYEPIDVTDTKVRTETDFQCETHGKYMVLDAITLRNLNVTENSSGETDGTLLKKMDHCCTAFGKRLLQRWICNPLRNLDSIKARQDAVTFLKNCSMIQDVRAVLSQLPDLERLLSKIHSLGSRGIRADHPDTRAFLFEETKYSKRKIIDFISTLNGFKKAKKMIESFDDVAVEEMPTLLKYCCRVDENNAQNSFPDLTESLEFFQRAFNHEEAQKVGRILPSEGTDADYDESMATLESIDKELNTYLKEQCTHFGCKVTYFGKDRKRYQLEVPDHACKRANSEYEIQGQRKGFKRYITARTKELLHKMMTAEEQKKNVLKNLGQRIFAKFSDKFDDWSRAIQCLSVLDVLISFAQYSLNENQTCVPEFVAISSSQQPFVELTDGVYPCSTAEDSFIPNNTVVGDLDSKARPSLILVTGPNMGGKSTLMRQLGLISIMAHMGCHVPAVKLRMSVVDRIFTRLGANDDIMAGESTFYIELCETSAILQHASKHSLVLIDELGRGTSTYDGTAIASAVLDELSRIRCRTLFSTHYHSLVQDFKNNGSVALGHMACMVESDEESGKEETVTFLYKFVEGACPKSYGFNAARLAGMPSHITKLGQERAKQIEQQAQNRCVFKKLFEFDLRTELETVRELIAAL